MLSTRKALLLFLLISFIFFFILRWSDIPNGNTRGIAFFDGFGCVQGQEAAHFLDRICWKYQSPVCRPLLESGMPRKLDVRAGTMGNDYTSLSSEDLMLRSAAGDKRSFSCLAERHKEQIFRLIYRFVESKDEANDLAQEVFLRVWRFSKQYQRTAKFSTWLYTITVNVCKTEVQSSWRRHIRLIGALWSADNDDDPKSQEPVAPNLSPEDAMLRAEQHTVVRSAIRSLPSKQRLALVLSRYEGLPYQEIATVLDCSVPAVESLLVRAKDTLRKKLSSLRK